MTQSVRGRAVLVVEDEPLLLMLAVEMVEGAGSEALEAANAAEAIGILDARDDIVVIFSDIEMPGTMDRLMLAATVRKRWPPIEIILTSGRVSVDESDLPDRGVFFSKPYDVAEVSKTLRRLAA